ncbi:hypothetical protein FW320_12605 [Azospirillum sp. Vi22]|uniref:hypothetical protein n=1 Tax=Azospirillum baldaniorum TaxID=1064539 RepID=UPI00157B50A3|nr:hypothetical protein [Azospirillum baldaniorum]NUB07011.1 hypothetical protein [Azospirillum baldaniorum]
MAAFPQMPNAPMVGASGRVERAWIEWLDRLRGYLAELDVLDTVADLEAAMADLEAMTGGLRSAVRQATQDIPALMARTTSLEGRATALETTTGTQAGQIAALTAADTGLGARITDLEVLATWQ